MKKNAPPFLFFLLFVLIFFSCNRDNPQPDLAHSEFTLETTTVSIYHDQTNQVEKNVKNAEAGFRGKWNERAGRCKPPIQNCAGETTKSGAYGYDELRLAVQSGKLEMFWNSPEGLDFLNSIDSRVKDDILSGLVTVKEFHGELFYVWPNATCYKEGFDYSYNGPGRRPIDSNCGSSE